MNPQKCLSPQRNALIVTRDDMLSQDLEQKLQGMKNFGSIDVVQDCLEGLEYIKNNHPDLIIFDAEVSVLEVLNALRTIKTVSQTSQCVVIADHIGYHALLSMVGADKVLYKGFTETELACCLN